ASVETSDIEVTDGMLVEVPKYTAVIISFNADDKNLVPAGELGEYMYQKVEELILDTDDGIKLIDKPLGRKKLIWTALPEDAFYTNVEFEIIENTANATLSSSAYVRADGATNGYITIKGTAMDLSGVTDEITIEITGQNVGIEDKGIEGINMYPNPASDLLNIELVENLPFRLRITNVQGAVVKDLNVNSGQVKINIEDLRQGVYFVHVIIDDRTEVLRFVKK
ncbi:MAG: T9SS type A sorting domain-containing protein, partial [Bacteroidales bacterium]